MEFKYTKNYRKIFPWCTCSHNIYRFGIFYHSIKPFLRYRKSKLENIFLHTVWIHGSNESSSGEAAGVSNESKECGRWVEINDEVKCNAAGEIDILSEPESPKSGVVIGPLILWLEYEWGDEEDPDDDGQGDKLIVDESTDPTEIEQPNWLFNTIDEDDDTLAWNGA